MAGLSRTIAFIHGNFVSRHCWEGWVERYEARGYRCFPIAWPGRDAPVAELKRRQDDPVLADLTIEEIVEHHVSSIRALGEPPILIGHSFGGLLTQLMLQRGLGVAGVAIDSVPPQGVLTTAWSFYRSLWPVLNPLIPVSRPYYMTFEQWQYSFVNDLPYEEQRASYQAEVVPESRRSSRGGLSHAAHIDFTRPHPPLLMIAGELDHIMPASLNRRNYERYCASPSVTDFKEFPDRAHYSIIAGSKNWQEVADYALDWAVQAQQLAATRQSLREHTERRWLHEGPPPLQ